MTAPWPLEVADLLPVPHETTCRAEAVLTQGGDPVPLELLRVELVWDETSAPRVRGTIAARVPDDLALVRALDPRVGARVRVHVGYRLGTGKVNEQLVADLGIRVRDVIRPDDELALELASDEALVMDNELLNYSGNTGENVLTVLRSCIINGVNTGGTGYFPTVTVDPSLDSTLEFPSPLGGLETWDAIEAMAGQLGADVFDDGLRGWQLTRKVPYPAPSRAQLRTGEGGTITRSRSRMTRELWANLVRLDFNDDYGQQQQLTGPFAAYGNAGLRALRFARPVRAHHSGGADAQTARALTTWLSRGRSLNVEAVAAWWLRPGHVVSVQLPTGNQERHLVARASFGWPADTMTLDLRLENGTVEPTGE